MIALNAKCMMFETEGGEAVPLSADMISIELTGAAAQAFESEFVDDAAGAVFHYFKHELKRETVTVAEFSEALEKALKSFNPKWEGSSAPGAAVVLQADLCQLAADCGSGCELVFFPRLRDEMRNLLKQSPDTLSFSGLKDCVKALTGSRRWNLQCRSLKDQIIQYLRECLSAENAKEGVSLMVR